MPARKLILIIVPLVVIALFSWMLLRRGAEPITRELRPGSPFGSGEDINIPALNSGTDTIGQTTQFDQNFEENAIFRISNNPVAGFIALNNRVRYVDRATGHIFETNLETGQKTRIANQTLPKIYEAYFRSDGNAVLTRSLKNDSDTIENLSLILTPPRNASGTSTELYRISAANLRGSIDSVTVGNNTLFYVLKDVPAIVSSTFAGSNIRTLFSSAFNNWRLGRLGNNLLVYTKAHSQAPGYTYSLPSTGGSLTKLIGPLNGLVAVGNPAGNRILYSYSDAGVTRLFAKNTQEAEGSEILPSTFAEKCVWSTKTATVFFCGTPIEEIGRNEPENWYQGITHFSDHIWRFNTSSEIAQLVSQPKTDFGLDLDVYQPVLTPDEKFLVFINKNDLTLWTVKLQ